MYQKWRLLCDINTIFAYICTNPHYEENSLYIYCRADDGFMCK